MSDLPTVLVPFATQCYRRLDLRYKPFQDEIRGIQNKAAAEGLALSGALIRRVLTAFGLEAKLRTEMVEATFRTYRLSCSPRAVADSASELRVLLAHLVRQTLQYARFDCEQAVFRLVHDPKMAPRNLSAVMTDEFDRTTKSLIGLIEAVAEEFIMAAETEINAKTETARPNYVHNSTYNAPVASVVHGDANVGAIHQHVGELEPSRLAKLVAEAMADWSQEDRHRAAGAAAAIYAEAKSPEPSPTLIRAAAARLGTLALNIGGAVTTQALLAYLRVIGVIPPGRRLSKGLTGNSGECSRIVEVGGRAQNDCATELNPMIDTMQVCRNGHLITSSAEKMPKQNLLRHRPKAVRRRPSCGAINLVPDPNNVRAFQRCLRLREELRATTAAATHVIQHSLSSRGARLDG